MNNLFSVNKLSKFYNRNKVLDIDQLNLNSGQFTILLGKNGSGKSTLMRLLAQQELFDGGNILFCGESLASPKVEMNFDMVFVSEGMEFPFSISLFDWAETYGHLYSKYDQNIFISLMQSFEINVKKKFATLSRGQKMKALFCLEAAKRPRIYFLDEITAVLDSGSRWVLMEFLREEVRRGCLVLMSTNIANEVQGFASDVIFLQEGKVIYQSPCEVFKTQFRKVRVASYVEDQTLNQLGARRVSFADNETWIYLHPRETTPEKAVQGVEEDLRAITIADIQSYFTTSLADQ
ncbi:MAG TPA: ABC transporter ATP-binding protein [Bdellovibrio sp.]|nr:ABC transporter ATP-binding protein [Bdellovibrio sp.]